MAVCRQLLTEHFYPRPPRGGRPSSIRFRPPLRLFLSTPSARRATTVFPVGFPILLFLSTPSARRATSNNAAMSYNSAISIHALREEGDRRRSRPRSSPSAFLSTPSARRATSSPYLGFRPVLISIHALREEGDVQYSRPHRPSLKFLSTPSARRATTR